MELEVEGKKEDKITPKNPKKTSKFTKVINKIDTIIGLSLIIPLANSFTLKLLIGNWVSYYSLHRITIYSIISMSIMAGILLYNLVFVFLALYFIYYHHRLSKAKKDIKKLSKTNSLISILNTLCNLSRSRNVVYAIYITISDLLLSFFFVLG